jgi:hypothetical protein
VSSSSAGIGSYTGSVTYTYVSGGTADLSVALTNTSTGTALKITGFVFNSVDNSLGVTLNPNPTGSFLNLDTSGGLDASPFGNFEIGAALGGDWSGGGSPSDGILVSQSGTFHFVVSGSASVLNGLSVMNFLTESGHDPSSDPKYQNQVFVVRLRGDGSDKVPVDVGGGTPGPVPETPLPAAALGGVGLLSGVGVMRRRRSR